jgi:hypothetical protein
MSHKALDDYILYFNLYGGLLNEGRSRKWLLIGKECLKSNFLSGLLSTAVLMIGLFSHVQHH